MVEAHWFMDTYHIARLSLIIYYHYLFYSVGHGVTIVTSHCYVRCHGSTRVTFLSNNSTIWHHNSRIWRHNSSTMTRGQYWKILPGQYGISSHDQYALLLKVMWPEIDQSPLSIYNLIYNKPWIYSPEQQFPMMFCCIKILSCCASDTTVLQWVRRAGQELRFRSSLVVWKHESEKKIQNKIMI